MPLLKVKTIGERNPQGKAKVYFTCHPEDFALYFDKLCEDIFKTHDCAIYYTENLTDSFSEQERELVLRYMKLFVVPITAKLLNEPNRAMTQDIAFAMKNGIPILPFMMESGLDEIYSQVDKFGERQYLNPFSFDLTEIPYAEKLKKYLNSVLINDQTAKRIRDVFDEYVFLSYRKKDRYYANKLIRKIHKYPEYQYIPIWYDEFLTPSESFKENIDKMLNRSKVFALLVTDSLFEESLVDSDYKPNFVMGYEYREALKMTPKIEIFPIEMSTTDKERLATEYGVSECINWENEQEFKERLAATLEKVAKAVDNKNPEHTFLVGLAYLHGIDMEVDCERAVGLITHAAEGESAEAMAQIVQMYRNGIGVECNLLTALEWQEKLVKKLECEADSFFGRNAEKDAELVQAMWALGDYNCELKRFQEAKLVYSRMEKIVYRLPCEWNLRYTTICQYNIAKIEFECNHFAEAKKHCSRALALASGRLEHKDSDALNDLYRVTQLYGDIYFALDPSQAPVFYLRAMQMAKELTIADDSVENCLGLSLTLTKLGDIYLECGVPDSSIYHDEDLPHDAEACYRESVLIIEKIVEGKPIGQYFKYLKSVLEKLCTLYREQKREDEWQACCKRIERIAQLMACQTTRTISQMKQGDSATMYRDSVGGQVKQYFDYDIHSLKRLGVYYEVYKKDYHLAIEYYKKAIEVASQLLKEEVSGAIQIEKAVLLSKCANVLEKEGKDKQAKNYYRKAIEIGDNINQSAASLDELRALSGVYKNFAFFLHCPRISWLQMLMSDREVRKKSEKYYSILSKCLKNPPSFVTFEKEFLKSLDGANGFTVYKQRKEYAKVLKKAEKLLKKIAVKGKKDDDWLLLGAFYYHVAKQECDKIRRAFAQKARAVFLRLYKKRQNDGALKTYLDECQTMM